MTEIPKRIWVETPDTGPRRAYLHCGSWPDERTPYIREDLHLAELAAAYEAAAEAGCMWASNSLEHEKAIRALASPDAKAALDRIVRQQVNEALEQAAVEIEDWQLFTKYTRENVTLEVAAAIRAMKGGDDGQ